MNVFVFYRDAELFSAKASNKTIVVYYFTKNSSAGFKQLISWIVAIEIVDTFKII